jgi:hypothetical protein
VPPFREAKAFASGTGDDADDSEKPLINEDF